MDINELIEDIIIDDKKYLKIWKNMQDFLCDYRIIETRKKDNKFLYFNC